MYLDDNNNVMPPACRRPVLNPPAPVYKPPITTFLKPYLDNMNVFECPADLPKDKNEFSVQGTSYEYNERLGGTPVTQSHF